MDLLIWGAGGHGKVVLDIARSTRSFNKIAFLDGDPLKTGTHFRGCPVFEALTKLNSFKGMAFIAAIGDNHTRKKCYETAIKNGLSPVAVVHPSAIISPSVVIGSGTVIMPGVIINADTTIGDNCIVNSGSVIEHDCKIDAHVHISPRAVLCGGVRVEFLAHIGTGAVILPGAFIGEESILGAGSVVLKESPPHCTVVGVPAKVILHKVFKQ